MLPVVSKAGNRSPGGRILAEFLNPSYLPDNIQGRRDCSRCFSRRVRETGPMNFTAR